MNVRGRAQEERLAAIDEAYALAERLGVTVGTDIGPLRELFEQRTALVRALLEIESGADGDCPACGASIHPVGHGEPHDNGCIVDAAMTKAGLPDAASRDAARKNR